MSIKPITYQGVSNFKSNLYALEVKSRFIDQSAADGYYKGYGEELRAIVSGNTITIGSGAFLVQGRLNEIETGGESVDVTIQNGYVGYVIARIETYHPDDTENCTLVIKTGTSLEAITLIREDTYQRSAESENNVYELPLYSFAMAGGVITGITKMISPIEENTDTRNIALSAKNVANEAKRIAESASSNASEAKTAANGAQSAATAAKASASEAKTAANGAQSAATAAEASASEAKTAANGAQSAATAAEANASEAKTAANGAQSAATAAATASSESANSAAEAAARMNEILKSVVDIMYPVGSIYMSVNNSDPGTLFGGRWETWGAGRVPVGIDASDSDFALPEKVGGFKTHTLTTQELPAHYHAVRNRLSGGTASSMKLQYELNSNSTANTYDSISATSSAGGGGAHNNLQPYITCYMWKRTE